MEPVTNHTPFSASTSLPSIKEVGREAARGRCAGEADKQMWAAVSACIWEERGGKARRSRALQRLKTEGCPLTPPQPGHRFLRSPSGRKGALSTKCPPAGSCPGAPAPRRAPPLGPRGWDWRWWAAEAGGEPRRPATGACADRVPARSPTVGTATPRSPAAAASPGPAGTGGGRELRPRARPRPASLFRRRPLARV